MLHDEDIKTSAEHYLKESALSYGISPADIAAILEKWGPAVLKLIIDGLKEGFTMAFLTEILSTLGPLFLTQAVNAKKTSRDMSKILKSAPAFGAHVKMTRRKSVLHEDSPIIQGGDKDPEKDAVDKSTDLLANALVAWFIQVLQQPTTHAALVEVLKNN